MNALEQIYKNLQDGKMYGYYYAMRFPDFHVCLTVDDSKKYIRWNNYGCSAKENTLSDLKWIITNIFEKTPEQFTSEYSIYDEGKFEEWEAIANSQNTSEYRKWISPTYILCL